MYAIEPLALQTAVKTPIKKNVVRIFRTVRIPCREKPAISRRLFPFQRPYPKKRHQPKTIAATMDVSVNTQAKSPAPNNPSNKNSIIRPAPTALLRPAALLLFAAFILPAAPSDP